MQPSRDRAKRRKKMFDEARNLGLDFNGDLACKYFDNGLVVCLCNAIDGGAVGSMSERGSLSFVAYTTNGEEMYEFFSTEDGADKYEVIFKNYASVRSAMNALAKMTKEQAASFYAKTYPDWEEARAKATEFYARKKGLVQERARRLRSLMALRPSMDVRRLAKRELDTVPEFELVSLSEFLGEVLSPGSFSNEDFVQEETLRKQGFQVTPEGLIAELKSVVMSD
jgi:hypothetical protein